MNSAFGNDSLSALTGGKPEAVKVAGCGGSTGGGTEQGLLNSPPVQAPAASQAGGRGQGQLRLSSGTQQCVIKALSIKEALLVVTPQRNPAAGTGQRRARPGAGRQRRSRPPEWLPARRRRLEPKPDSDWLQLTFRFVDQDAQKLDYISRLIARGTAQKHFVPGA
jgi:hypothetical protein